MQQVNGIDFREVFDKLPVNALIVDENHKVVAVNSEYEGKLCQPYVDAVGGHCPIVSHDCQDPLPACPLLESLASGEPETRIVFEPKRQVWLESSVAPLEATGPDGARLFVHTVRNVTEEMERKESLEETMEIMARRGRELEEARTVREEFLARMSHELRTPLNSVIGFSGVLAQRLAGELNNEQVEQVEMIRHSGQQLLALIDNLFSLDSLNHDNVAVMPVEVRLSSLVARAIGDARTTAGPLADDTELSVDISRDGTIVTDERLVLQIVGNVLDNAIRNSSGGRVTVRARFGSLSCVIQVIDSGPGIPPEYIERVFEPFARAMRPNHEQGAGIGLTVAHGLALRLGGDLSVSSPPGEGATFTLVLPTKANGIE